MYAQPTDSGFLGRARSNPSFSDLVIGLLHRIDARRADSAEEREAIFRLRYEAYRREGVIPANPSATFSDAYDQTPNAYLLGLYIEGKLASSIRIHVVSKDYPHSPSLDTFSDILQPELDAGKIIIDPNRFVADETLSRLHVGLPYATLRLCFLAAEYFHADVGLAPVRVEHQAFYRRALNYHLLCEPRPYPQIARPLSLMAIRYSAVDELWRQYPYIRSTFFERRTLFERGPTAARQDAVGLQENRAPFVECDPERLPG